jgi:transaldolase/glucose-6-phosphate isomerase
VDERRAAYHAAEAMSDRPAAGGTATTRDALRCRVRLPDSLAAPVDAVLKDWQSGQKSRRVWARDSGLWTGGDEGAWLGWLDLPEAQLLRGDRLASLAPRPEGSLAHVLLLGRGTSSR